MMPQATTVFSGRWIGALQRPLVGGADPFHRPHPDLLPSGTVDKYELSLDTAAERTRPTRDQRRKALKIKQPIRSPRVAAVSWRRSEGRLARKSTVPSGRRHPRPIRHRNCEKRH
jgi:hypothetical protein